MITSDKKNVGNECILLNATERFRLGKLESTVEKGLASFFAVGSALKEIRDGKLYRDEHGTFEDYCQSRWGFSDRHARRHIEAAGVQVNLGPIGPVLPAHEAQCRPLTRLQEVDQQAAWKSVLERAPENKDGCKQITATLVQKVVDEIAGREVVAPNSRNHTSRHYDERLLDDDCAAIGSSGGWSVWVEPSMHNRYAHIAVFESATRIVDYTKRPVKREEVPFSIDSMLPHDITVELDCETTSRRVAHSSFQFTEAHTDPLDDGSKNTTFVTTAANAVDVSGISDDHNDGSPACERKVAHDDQQFHDFLKFVDGKLMMTAAQIAEGFGVSIGRARKLIFAASVHPAVVAAVSDNGRKRGFLVDWTEQSASEWLHEIQHNGPRSRRLDDQLEQAIDSAIAVMNGFYHAHRNSFHKANPRNPKRLAIRTDVLRKTAEKFTNDITTRVLEVAS